jgi:LacI family transcriptional regulator
MILLGTEMNAGDLSPFLSLSFPLVLLDAYFDTVPCDCVLMDNLQGAYLAARYLIRKCKTQPGYLRSSYQIGNFSRRATGFYNAVRDFGMSASKSIVHRLPPSIDGAYADMLEIIQSKETLAPCYFADNDLIAVGAMKAFRQCDISVPGDISVVGFDNMPVSSVIEPALTTVHVPKQYMGECAVRRLTEIMQNPGQPPVKIEVSTTLMKRQSVRLLP